MGRLVVGPTAMKGTAVVPYDEVGKPPMMSVDKAWLSGEPDEPAQKFASLFYGQPNYV
jgi:hypothetical protein